MFWKGQQHERKHRRVDTRGMQGTVGCCAVAEVSRGTGHLLSWELGEDSPCRAKGDALGGSTTHSALSSLTQLLRVAAQTHGEPAAVVPLDDQC